MKSREYRPVRVYPTGALRTTGATSGLTGKFRDKSGPLLANSADEVNAFFRLSRLKQWSGLSGGRGIRSARLASDVREVVKSQPRGQNRRGRRRPALDQRAARETLMNYAQ